MGVRWPPSWVLYPISSLFPGWSDPQLLPWFSSRVPGKISPFPNLVRCDNVNPIPLSLSRPFMGLSCRFCSPSKPIYFMYSDPWFFSLPASYKSWDLCVSRSCLKLRFSMRRRPDRKNSMTPERTKVKNRQCLVSHYQSKMHTTCE